MSSLDPDLLAKLRARDRALLEQIFREVNPYLLRLLGARGILNEHAEEVLYSAWETFFTSLDRFEGRSQIRVYVAGILLNKIREYRRAQGRFVSEEDAAGILEASFTPVGLWRTDPPDPRAVLEAKESASFLKECLESLSASQRDAFLLREADGEKSETICKILDVSITNLGVLLFRAKDKLRKCLEGKVHALP